jgi:hypothetical protein
MSGIGMISFDEGDDVVKKGGFDKYKPEVKGHTDRISVVLRVRDKEGVADMSKVGFVAVDRHFIEDNGYILCSKGYCCEKFGAPTSTVATIILQYPTNKDGEINKSELADYKKTCKVLPWIFSGEKYFDLKRRNKNNPLVKHDLEVTCKDPKYQKLDVIPAGEAIWLKNEEFKKFVMVQVANLEPNLEKQLGKKMTADEIKEAFGDHIDNPVQGGQSTENFDDLLNGM